MQGISIFTGNLEMLWVVYFNKKQVKLTNILASSYSNLISKEIASRGDDIDTYINCRATLLFYHKSG